MSASLVSNLTIVCLFSRQPNYHTTMFRDVWHLNYMYLATYIDYCLNVIRKLFCALEMNLSHEAFCLFGWLSRIISENV